MYVPANEKVRLLIEQLRLKAALLDSAADREALRTIALAMERLNGQLLHNLQVEIIAELMSNTPMPQHGFTGAAPRPRQFTVDDL